MKETRLSRRLPDSLLLALALLLAFAASAAAEGKRLTTEEDFRELVVDRELTGNRTTLRYTGDGRMVGVVRGQRLEGRWGWASAALCRTATLGSRDLGHDCAAIFVIGDLVVIVRDEGRGSAFALRFRIKGSQPSGPGEFLARCSGC